MYLTDEGGLSNTALAVVTGALAFLGGLVGVIATWRASWKVIAEMRKAEAEEWKRKYDAEASVNVALSRDYHQVMDFNVQDRVTKDLLAEEVIRLCALTNEDAAAILFRIKLEAKADSQKRQLLNGIHHTKSGEYRQ